MLLLLLNQPAAAAKAQTLAATLDSVTVAAAQTAQHTQTLAATLADVAVSASQTARHAQSLSATLDGVTVAVAQTKASAANAQALAATLDSVAVVAAQTATHGQALTATLADVSASAVQTVAHPQALAAALDDAVFAAVQAKASAGNAQALSVTLDDVGFDAVQAGSLLPTPAGGWDDDKPKRRKHRYLVEINGKLIDVGSVRNVQEHFAAEAANEPAPKPQKRQRVVADVEAIKRAAIAQNLLAEFEERRQAKEYAAMVAAYRAWQDEEDIETLLLFA